uniref:Uncharacterized protein n=1 Tax=Heliothis virescens TaxID=7102 RepID=A0A2A4IVP6_HELVI
MLLPGKISPKTWLFVTILVSTIIAFSESSEGKTHSAEYNPRAVDDDSSSDSSSSSSNKKKSSPRVESGGSDEKVRSKKEEAKEPPKAPKSSNSDDDDDDKNSSREDKLRVTRGLKTGDFEPEEENPKIHSRYKKNSDSENSDGKCLNDRRRYRRSIDRFANNDEINAYY